MGDKQPLDTLPQMNKFSNEPEYCNGMMQPVACTRMSETIILI